MGSRKSPLIRLNELGQSLWLDHIDRRLIREGRLRKLIDEDRLRGVTSNPKIFDQAIAETNDYDDDIERLAAKDHDAESIYQQLAVGTVQEAADVFRGVYDETDGRDGYISLEVSPHLARDTEGTIREVKRLWGMVERPNVLIKIPGTVEGLPAIRQSLADGININITLLFGLARYNQVANAYIEALEERAERGDPIDRIGSVASFFLSRIDVLVDPMLEKIARGGAGAELAESLHGRVAVSAARVAYQMYKDIFSGPRWDALKAKGARTQRLLWASTSTKNPNYSDVKYVDALIGPETVNTVPMETLDAFRDHGEPAARLEAGVRDAQHVLSRLEDLQIDMDEVVARLIEEGIEKFNEPYDDLLETVEEKRSAAV